MIEQDNGMKHMEADNLTKIPTIPVIIQCVMPGTWRHLSHTRRKRIGGRPSSLDLLSACPSSPFCITQTETLSALLSMPIDMPAWNSNIDSCFRLDLHVLRELQHASAEVLRPLTADVISDEDPWEYDPNKCHKDKKIHITIPKGTKDKSWHDFICQEHTFCLSEGPQPHSSALAHVESR